MQKKEKVLNSRNNTIDIVKFLFTLIIVLYHICINIDGFYIFKRGLLAVDFFFIVSGYLFYYSVKKMTSKSNSNSDNVYLDGLRMIWKKFKTFFPYVLVGFFAHLMYAIFILKIKKHTIFNSIFTLLLLHMTGLPMAKINNATWYISVMLVSMFILHPILRKHEKRYMYYFGPLIVVLGFGLYSKYFSNFNSFASFSLVYKGMARGFLEINLGILLAYVGNWFKSINLTTLSRILMTILEILGYLFAMLLMNTLNAKMDIFLVLVLAVTIFISFSKESYTTKITDKLSFKNIDTFSLSIYCTHIASIAWFEVINDSFFHLEGYSLGFIMFIVSILLAYIIYKMVTLIVPRLNIKEWFIKQ